MKQIKISTLILLCAIALSVSLFSVAALTGFSGTISWSNAGTKTFEVYDVSTGGTVLTTPHSITGATFGSNTYTYYIQNTGNVPITITVNEGPETGCTATWVPTSTSVSVGTTRVLMTLTLDVTSNSGSYGWTFVVT